MSTLEFELKYDEDKWDGQRGEKGWNVNVYYCQHRKMALIGFHFHDLSRQEKDAQVNKTIVFEKITLADATRRAIKMFDHFKTKEWFDYEVTESALHSVL